MNHPTNNIYHSFREEQEALEQIESAIVKKRRELDMIYKEWNLLKKTHEKEEEELYGKRVVS